mmetsp:Transcript_120568/g.240062  ORF Transcript_120568/g.240062 Transcript_120568/m.240062 type:complete len:81 (-) Transcript_120568:732-974(-)
MWVLRCAADSAPARFVGLLGQLPDGATVTGTATAGAVPVHPGVRLKEEPQAETAEFVLHNVGVALAVCGMNVLLDGVALL